MISYKEGKHFNAVIVPNSELCRGPAFYSLRNSTLVRLTGQLKGTSSKNHIRPLYQWMIKKRIPKEWNSTLGSTPTCHLLMKQKFEIIEQSHPIINQTS